MTERWQKKGIPSPKQEKNILSDGRCNGDCNKIALEIAAQVERQMVNGSKISYDFYGCNLSREKTLFFKLHKLSGIFKFCAGCIKTVEPASLYFLQVATVLFSRYELQRSLRVYQSLANPATILFARKVAREIVANLCMTISISSSLQQLACNRL